LLHFFTINLAASEVKQAKNKGILPHIEKPEKWRRSVARRVFENVYGQKNLNGIKGSLRPFKGQIWRVFSVLRFFTDHFYFHFSLFQARRIYA
jgi:hypothetical protein